MLWARSLLLIGLASVAVSTGEGRAQSLFPFPIPFPSVPSLPHPGAASLPSPNIFSSTPETPTYLPPDADPNYSTPGGFDKDVNFNVATRKEVSDPTGEPPGTITINTGERKLYLSLGDGRAIQYGIGVGRQGFSWKGVAEVGRKSFWPGWTPPPEMLARQPELPDHMDGGMENPLGARALYLFQGTKDTLFRIHGTNDPKSIGHAVSSGCIRMLDSDVIDLYQRVAKGTRVVVL
jgi:lipoprotein-anchoring transpeptidase ErfK/SrfK